MLLNRAPGWHVSGHPVVAAWTCYSDLGTMQIVYYLFDTKRPGNFCGVRLETIIRLIQNGIIRLIPFRTAS